MEALLKPILLLFLVIYVGSVYLWRIYVIRRSTGMWPIMYGGTTSLHDVIGKLFALLIGLSIANIIVYVFSSALYRYLLPFHWMETTALQIAGMLLAWASMFWTIAAQRQMGSSWRIGIDAKTKTSLITGGPFRLSRHPIYLGMIVTALGLFMLMPNVLSLLILAATITTISVQARLEEEHLAKLHGDPYVDYLKSTRRWL
jgi:protein-S-isoprenylcysteine O-methyltransferase Ste14